MNLPDIDMLYRRCWSKETGDLLLSLNQSLGPRPPSVLYDTLGALHINKESSVLDIGCGWGVYSSDLVTRFGCHVTGVDLATINIELALERAKSMGINEQTTFLQGDIQALPFADALFDFIWCYDMIEHIPSLKQGLQECARVLKPAGAMLIQTGFVAHRFPFYDDEERDVYNTLHICKSNLQQSFFERTLEEIGVKIHSKEQIGSEWIEYFSEQQEIHSDRIDPRENISLLHFSRLQRGKAQLINAFGQKAYDVVYAIQFLQIQQILGNINTVVYIIKKA
jgi:ubiquinone/menaquinone biosynthesis C-methylase UbiE